MNNNKNKEIGDRIATRRKELDITLDYIAEQIGVSKSTIQRYEKGGFSNPKLVVLEAIARVLNVDPAWLVGKPRVSKLDDIAVPYKPTMYIPILGRISAGLPLYAAEYIEGYTYVDYKDGEEYFGLIVKGDSMSAARIQEGDIVIVRRQSCVDNGDIAVVIVDGSDATIKRFFKKENMITLNPQSLNPVHVAQIYDRTTDVRVIGKVVEVKFRP